MAELTKKEKAIHLESKTPEEFRVTNWEYGDEVDAGFIVSNHTVTFVEYGKTAFQVSVMLWPALKQAIKIAESLKDEQHKAITFDVDPKYHPLSPPFSIL